ncbi:hypothetical protein [Calothrix sp. UHCC 0171]|uniref:hypothetical protein n=1 Tax=Calothrix sp. UHCC 0171 TaxID=3110245 RepID=UPI002B20885B|nr:hypothetical protein [Calothrix sp. UHCC 0171]MEA5569771.1 hypothetical protein [Calothrix sp. UHCC 0171]
MRNDLQGLDISQKELQQLTDLPVHEELILVVGALKKIAKKFLEKVKGPEAATAYFIAIAPLFFSYFIFTVFISLFLPGLNVIPAWILFLLFLVSGGGLSQLGFYYIWKYRSKIVRENITPSLRILLSDVERYNNVIRAININDQIEAAGNIDVSIKERKRILEALKLTRADLIRALKTERILRENKNFIISNTELFANNLPTLSAMQVSEQASEHGRLLNEALQIALDVQLEMKRLQSQS